VIVTHKLTKHYGHHRVLDGIGIKVSANRLTGFLGPNGAGKTTTMRILLGLLNATAGSATIFGHDSRSLGKTIRQRIGYLPGDVHLYSSISGKATLKHFARVRRMNCDAEITRLADRLQLPLNRKVRKYSTGMRQKLGLIQALMHRPELLMLDEPTSALDPLIREEVFSELRQVVAQGRTVLFSSHSLDEVEDLCDDVIILRAGLVVEQQQINLLRQRALRKVTLVFADVTAVPDQIPQALKLLRRQERSLVCTWSGGLKPLLSWISQFQLDDLMIERPDLGDLFLTYYSGSGNQPSCDPVTRDAEATSGANHD